MRNHIALENLAGVLQEQEQTQALALAGVSGVAVLAIASMAGGVAVTGTAVALALGTVVGMVAEGADLGSAAKIILATTPLYWAPKMFISWQEKGFYSQIMAAIIGTITTTLADARIFSMVYNVLPPEAIHSIYSASTAPYENATSLLVGIVAALQLDNVYRTWNKYSALEAETGESERSKLPVVGLQLLAAGTVLANAAGVGLLAGVYIPIVFGATQLALHLYADKVISERRSNVDKIGLMRE